VGLNAQVLGISVDHIPCIKAWTETLGGINYPLLSDFWPHGAVAKEYGVLRPDGTSERAIFIVDGEGIIRYIDIHDFDDQPNNEIIRKILTEMNPTGDNTVLTSVSGGLKNLPKGGIVIYCTKWCPDCRRSRKWFEEKNIPYTEVDITIETWAAERVMAWANGYRTTPTFDIDGTIIVDWDENKLSETLAEKGYIK